jgi:hypothetical protein
MAISFSDEELKTTSKVILFTPIEIASLNDQKANALLGQADMLKKDDANKPFYNNYKNILTKYFDELKNINGESRPAYTDALLEDAAQLKDGNVHYPTTSPVWAGLSPKSVNQNLGLPVTNLTDFEIQRLTNTTTSISQLKSGFTDGTTSTTSTAAYSGGTSLSVTGGTFVANQRIVVFAGGRSALLKVTAVTVIPPVPPATGSTNLTVTVLAAPAATISTGATVRNYFSGFTNTERESGTSSLPEVQAYYQNNILAEVTAWKGFLNAQLSALNANDAVGTEATQNSTAKSNVQNALSAISAWESAPATGAGTGKYGNTVLAPLENKVTDRTSQAPARATEINSSLGALAQSPDGSFTGSGNIYKLFQWIDLRISKSSGTLFSYYNFNLITGFIDDKILKANTKKAEYDQFMIVKKIVAEPNGSNTIKLDNATGLSLGNAVKIMDDVLPITNATVSGISGQFVTLSVPISGYALDKFARLVKLL